MEVTLMQIINIILYKDQVRTRVLPFEIGKVNIITGESKTGKTAIIDIIDYCLGSKDCNIADGKVIENVYWFGITLQFRDEQIFIARQNPNSLGQKTTYEVFILKSNSFGNPPAFDSIKTNSNIDALKILLGNKIGIGEYEHKPDGYTRESLTVSFNHSRIFCFQPQYLIAQRNYLFYKQTEPFVPQAIKDTLPYFFGAIREDNLKIEQELTIKRKQLNRLLRQQKDAEKIKSEGINKIYELLEEAKEVELINSKLIPKDDKEAIEILSTVLDWENLDPASTGEDETLDRLLEEKKELKFELSKINSDISAAESFAFESEDYTDEMKHQKMRLLSIELYKEPKKGKEWNSLLGKEVDEITPTISEINKNLKTLQNNLSTTNRERPRLRKYINSLKIIQTEVQDKLNLIQNQIKALYKEKEEAKKLKDLNIRKGKVIGKVSLFLESLDITEEFSELIDKIRELEREIEFLEAKISYEEKLQRLNSILNKINLQMSRWAEYLDLEYKEAPIRFDLKKLTIFADTIEKPIPLNQMGSCANWVGYHLLLHFAFHKHFIQSNRPVPRFLVLDQPTQAYYPPDYQEINGQYKESSDEQAVKQMFEFIIKKTEELSPNFQVIVTDHANLSFSKFQESVAETWRNGKKLIPEEWYLR
jgi:hypothetical protein